MNRPRKILSLVLLLVVFTGVWFAFDYRNARQEEAQIRNRYAQMVRALTSGDTNAATALFPPESRRVAHRSLGVLTTFTKPLGPKSSVRFSKSEAVVCPERVYYFGVIPGGHTIDLVKVEGQWFFTGGVHVD